ncbi:CDK5 regulatory subunit associated protein 1 [Chamberlinius hualienensis]
MAGSMRFARCCGNIDWNIRKNIVLKCCPRKCSVANVHHNIFSNDGRYCHTDSSDAIKYSLSGDNDAKKSFKERLKDGPGLSQFINRTVATNDQSKLSKSRSRLPVELITHPYISTCDVDGNGKKVYFEVFGCQMNVNDTEIAWSILKNHGYDRTTDLKLADVVLVMTCSIREGAEQKVFNMLKHFRSYKRIRGNKSPVKIGILGCMAERLKTKLLERENCIDVIAGPDSYRSLPHLLADTSSGQAAVNVLLSHDETYADVMPVRLNENLKSAFVSIQRGCDNMCSFCIVPFTRGHERSRPVSSILDEVRKLSDQGVKEVILLGQNVNSYQDKTKGEKTVVTKLSSGFSTVYKSKIGGLRFADLLEKVSEINPEMRIRFTSPHPKDFPDEVLHLIKERHNICKQIHLPAQSGNNRILKLMRRGYTRESYLSLVERIRFLIPDVALTSDFICGFGNETEDEFCDTLSLMKEVKFNFSYVFPYSMRERTLAHRQLTDDIPQEVKIDRLNRMVSVFRECAEILNRRKINTRQLVLVEGPSKRSKANLSGRNDQNTKVIFPGCEIPVDTNMDAYKAIVPGDYITVHINDSSSQVLKGIPLYHSSLQNFHDKNTECHYPVRMV